MNIVILWFLQTHLGGGTTTYTAHLCKALKLNGVNAIIARIKEKPKAIFEPFGQYGDDMLIANWSETIAEWYSDRVPSIITAVGPDHDHTRMLLANGARAILHDPTQFAHFNLRKLRRPICIRQSMLKLVEQAIFIPHPYYRSCDSNRDAAGKNKYHAISLARVHNQKRSVMLVKANELLPKEKRILLLGKEFRLYSYALQKRYKSYRQSGKQFQFPLTYDAAVNLAAQAKYNVDMTYIENDGGGSQYSQLEAMDAGCVNVMHADWFRVKGTLPKSTILTVSSHEDLALLMEHGVSNYKLQNVIQCAYEYLKLHDAKAVGKKYLAELAK